MMYLKLNADYKQGELVPLLDDAIYVYCDVCKSLHRIEDDYPTTFSLSYTYLRCGALSPLHLP